RLRGVRPGVDLVLRRGEGNRFEYDLVLRTGADPRAVALEFRGGERPHLDRLGGLIVRTPAGDLRQAPPVAFQRIEGRRVPVPAWFRVHADGSVGFRL